MLCSGSELGLTDADYEGAHELRVYHRCAEPLAEVSESDVRYVLHWCEEQRSFPKLYVSYVHVVLCSFLS